MNVAKKLNLILGKKRKFNALHDFYFFVIIKSKEISKEKLKLITKKQAENNAENKSNEKPKFELKTVKRNVEKENLLPPPVTVDSGVVRKEKIKQINKSHPQFRKTNYDNDDTNTKKKFNKEPKFEVKTVRKKVSEKKISSSPVRISKHSAVEIGMSFAGAAGATVKNDQQIDRNPNPFKDVFLQYTIPTKSAETNEWSSRNNEIPKYQGKTSPFIKKSKQSPQAQTFNQNEKEKSKRKRRNKKKKKKIDDKEKQEKPQEQKQQETKNTTRRSNRSESSPTSAEIKKLQNEMASFEQDKAQFMLNQKVAENKLKDMRFDLIEQKRKLIEQERSLEESRTLSQSQAVLRKTQSSAEVLRKKQKKLPQVRRKETNVSDQIIQEKYLNPQSLLNSNSFSEERNYYTTSNTDVIIPISRPSPEYLKESNDQLITNLESKVGEYERFKKLTEESIRRFRDEEKTYISENNKFQGKINKMEMELENYKMQLRKLM